MKDNDNNIIPTRMLLKYEDRWIEKGVENG